MLGSGFKKNFYGSDYVKGNIEEMESEAEITAG